MTYDKIVKNGKVYYILSLATKVLVVADRSAHHPVEWCAYIDGVAGKNHDIEWEAVAANGNKLDFQIAKILFPNLAEKYRWRS